MSRTELASYVQAKAPGLGLDPAAVLAVASQEGAGGGIGDAGTSFGPWQLHYGGAYPASAPRGSPAASQAWAWSPAGIDYALSRMASVAKGLVGYPSVSAIVSDFERPANPGAEILGAEAAYGQAGGLGGGSTALTTSPGRPGSGGGTSFWSGFISGVENSVAPGLGLADGFFGASGKAVGAAESALKAPLDFLKAALWLINPVTWLRAVETLIGLVLVIGGILVMLGADRAIRNLPGPTGAAASLAAEA